MAKSYRDAAVEAQRSRVKAANAAYHPEAMTRADAAIAAVPPDQYAPHAQTQMGAAGVNTTPYYKGGRSAAADAQAEQQMRMQAALSEQEYAVLQNLLAESDRWHGQNEYGDRVFTGRRGMSPDELDRLRTKGGKTRMVSKREAARDTAREDARRQQAERMEAQRRAREQQEAAAAPERNLQAAGRRMI